MTDRLSCLAPATAMRFSPNGEIHVCCVNDTYVLGRVDRDSLHTVWNGERLARLRRAVDAGDGSLGCSACARDHERGLRAQTHAEQFDRFGDDVPARWPRRLEFAASSTCNLLCVHCNGELSSAIRSRREHRPPIPDLYGELFFEEIGEFLDHATVTTFLGGEPFIARPTRRIWDVMIERGCRPEVHVTTNGTVWNDEVVHYLDSLRMNVAVSIDGVDRETFEHIRVGADFDQVCQNRDRLRSMTRTYGGSFIINHCLLRENVSRLYDMLADADRREMDVHVIPVTYPPRLSVFELPVDELQDIVEDLESGERSGPALGRNQPMWRQTLHHLRDVLGERRQGGGSRDVAVGLPSVSPAVLEESIERQAARGGDRPLRLHFVGDVLASTMVPPWAEDWAPDAWIGRSDRFVLEDLCSRLGGEPAWVVHGSGPNLTEVELRIEGAGGATVLRVDVFDRQHEDPPVRDLVIAVPTSGTPAGPAPDGGSAASA